MEFRSHIFSSKIFLNYDRPGRCRILWRSFCLGKPVDVEWLAVEVELFQSVQLGCVPAT